MTQANGLFDEHTAIFRRAYGAFLLERATFRHNIANADTNSDRSVMRTVANSDARTADSDIDTAYSDVRAANSDIQTANSDVPTGAARMQSSGKFRCARGQV